jgi:thiol-disulfide isomerase/thioredoxin
MAAKTAILLAIIGTAFVALHAQGEMPRAPQGLILGPKVIAVEGTHQLSPPALQFHPSGALQLAWTEKQQEKRVLRTIRLLPDSDSRDGSIQVNSADFQPDSLHQAPGLATGPAGEVFITWAVPTPSGAAAFATDLMLARSPGGASGFDRPVRVNDDGRPISHTFEQLLAVDDRDVYLAWLDNRTKEKSGAAAMFASSRDGGRTIGANRVVDGMACPCCRPALARGPDGTLWVAWRKTFEGNVRDIVLAQSRDQGHSFSAPRLVHKDGWAFPACPHRGPSLGTDRRGRLYLGWYTEGTDEQPRLLFTVSDDHGQTFSPPRSLHTSTTSLPDQLRFAVHPEGAVVAVWEEVTGVRKRVVMRVSTDRGAAFGVQQILSEGAKAEAPTVAIHPNGTVALGWTEHAWPNNRLVVQFGRLTSGVKAQELSSDPYLAAGVQKLSGQGAMSALYALPTLKGPPVDPAALKGNVVIVNFWATWCVPCKEEMPSLERLQRRFDSDRVRVVAVTTDQQEEQMQAFAKSLGLSIPILIDHTREVSAVFGVRGLPTTVIIGPDGTLRGRAVGPRQWDGEAAVALVNSLLS